MEEKFYIVVNGEEQYSVWPTYHPVPNGWSVVGEEAASREDCLDRIEEIWPDITPLSVRKARVS